MEWNKEEGGKGALLFCAQSVTPAMSQSGHGVNNFSLCLTSPTCTIAMALPPYFLSQLSIQQWFKGLAELA